MLRKALSFFGFKLNTTKTVVVRQVKRSDKPALTYATHGNVLLDGKIEEV